ncbi:aspartate carbamoyltransferase regulatory chain [Oxobacter pfennigii]|uniref:Aspartate carbamoyltransferase regulatory chain n=1 Tax=Oxobacter pfennigii TaxID=36849 RepID=A0A0P8W4M3_9CLOT|nr:aspartate carbamoyltransferase regulatory subunit [Oxobacter pfennigii]KPU42727.1 aspartate carbamoyltransferase regulatory chain [Oxobacter pfennigii]
MLTINSITNGIVIDHIKAGLGMKIFNYLGLDKTDYTVALLMNVPSQKLGRKDIIKIENAIDFDFTVLGLIDPDITIDVIEGEKIKEKIKVQPPSNVKDMLKCKNPRCVTSVESNITNGFYLVDASKGEYRCEYCDEIYKL